MNLNTTISFALVAKAKAKAIKTKNMGKKKKKTSKQTAWGNDLIDLDNGYLPELWGGKLDSRE
jgi:hypothetical protein